MSTAWVVLLFLVNTLVMPLAVEMIKERAPRLAICLIRLATRILPRHHRERYLAEWSAEIEEMQRQNISQLLFSARILVSAPITGSVLRASDRSRSAARERQRITGRVNRAARRLAFGPSHRYRQSMLADLRYVDQQGLMTLGFYTPELDDVFVEVPLTKSTQGRHDRLSLSTILDQPRPVVLAILGAPGTGKTTLLRHTVRQTCSAPRGRRRTIPALLYLREHAPAIISNPSIALPEVLRQSIRRSFHTEPAEWFERRLRHGDCIVLLDGMDEVMSDARRSVARWIDRQIQQYHRNDFVLTSRPLNYLDASLASATVLQTCPLTDEQVSTFLAKWCLAVERHLPQTGSGAHDRAKPAADDLVNQLARSPGLSALTVNPLLLNMIANVYLYRGTLPNARHALCREICQVLLQTRQQAKGIHSHLRVDHKEATLGHLAFTMMQQCKYELPHIDVIAILDLTLDQLLSESSADELLADLLHSGLLVEREGAYRFAHLVLQEYSAACHIDASFPNSVLITNHVDEVWWKETILLYVAQAGTDQVNEIVRACISSGTDVALSLALACIDQRDDIAPELRRIITRLTDPS